MIAIFRVKNQIRVPEQSLIPNRANRCDTSILILSNPVMQVVNGFSFGLVSTSWMFWKKDGCRTDRLAASNPVPRCGGWIVNGSTSRVFLSLQHNMSPGPGLQRLFTHAIANSFSKKATAGCIVHLDSSIGLANANKSLQN